LAALALKRSLSRAQLCTGVNCEQPAAMLDRIERRITLIGELPLEQRQRLLEIANLCPAHKSLTSRIDIQTELVNLSS
jgi:putative redox protein